MTLSVSSGVVISAMEQLHDPKVHDENWAVQEVEYQKL